jgi:hypothetical protein
MDWCKRNGIAPATRDSLFAMVKDARNKFDTTPPAAPVQVLQRYSLDGEGGMEVDSLGAYVKHQDVASQTVTQSVQTIEEKYNELLYAVGNKFPGESRHETALRYIQQAEVSNEMPAPNDARGQQ